MTKAAPPDPARDALLCGQVQSGRSALAELVARHTPMVVSILSKMHLQPGVDGDDLIQSGLIALTHAASKWRSDGGSRFGTYAYTCVLHAMHRSAGDQARKASSLNRHPLDADGMEVLDLLPCPEPPKLPVDVRERMVKLPRLLQRVLSLRFGLDGEPKNLGEIAALLDLTVNQVKKALDVSLSKV